MAKSFGEAFKEARAAGLSEFTFEGNRYSTALAEETKEDKDLTESERIMQAMEDYEDNYNLRSIADVEYRADLDPYISGTPVSLLGFDEIYKETDGDIGQRMKVIMGEDDPNNITFYKGTPDEINMYGSTATGYYSPEEDERYYGEGSPSEAIPGVAYASAHGKDPLRTMAHEIGHKGMRVLENKDLIPEIRLSLEERLMKELKGRSNVNIPADAYYQNNNLSEELFDRVDSASLNELRERGRPSIVKNKVKQDPDFNKKRAEYRSYQNESILDGLRRYLAGKEKPVNPVRKYQKELYRYAGGGIVSLLGKD